MYPACGKGLITGIVTFARRVTPSEIQTRMFAAPPAPRFAIGTRICTDWPALGIAGVNVGWVGVRSGGEAKPGGGIMTWTAFEASARSNAGYAEKVTEPVPTWGAHVAVSAKAPTNREFGMVVLSIQSERRGMWAIPSAPVTRQVPAVLPM